MIFFIWLLVLFKECDTHFSVHTDKEQQGIRQDNGVLSGQARSYHATIPPPSVEMSGKQTTVLYGHDSSALDRAGPLNTPHLFIQSRGLISRAGADKRFENRNPIPIISLPYCLY